MVKNFIIAVQAIVIVFGSFWVYYYQHRMDQVFLVTGINYMAIDTRLFLKLEHKIAEGKVDVARKVLRNVAASNIKDMKASLERVDVDMGDLIAESRESAAMLHEVGIHDVSAAIDQRVKEQHN